MSSPAVDALKVLTDANVVPPGLEMVSILQTKQRFIVCWTKSWRHYEHECRYGNYLIYTASMDFWSIPTVDVAYQQLQRQRRQEMVETVLKNTELGCESGLGRLVADYFV